MPLKIPKMKLGDDLVPRPVFRDVSDVMRYASDMIRQMANEQKMLATVAEIIKDKRIMAEAPDSVKTALLEPDLQAHTLFSAAQLLSDLAAEHKVLELREKERR